MTHPNFNILLAKMAELVTKTVKMQVNLSVKKPLCMARHKETDI